MIQKSRRKRKNMLKIFIILLCLLLVLLTIRFTVSRYQTKSNSNGSLDIAFYLVKEDYQTMNIKLDSIIPRDEAYTYTFAISNTNGTNRADVNLTYDLTIVATTNLPLNYELLINGSDAIITNTVAQDGDGTYFRTITTQTQELDYTTDKTNTYKLNVYFPAEYDDINYQDIVDAVQIKVNSRQKIE